MFIQFLRAMDLKKGKLVRNIFSGNVGEITHKVLMKSGVVSIKRQLQNGKWVKTTWIIQNLNPVSSSP